MDQAHLIQTLADLPLGPLRYFDRLGSTNTEAAAWADQGAPDLSLVVADEQTAGRGRQGRRWYTPPGAALAFSLVLRPAQWIPASLLIANRTAAGTPDPDDGAGALDLPAWLGRLTALGALAVCDTLKDVPGLAPRIKWPNDVLLERRKVCGVLAEAHWNGANLAAVILGIGLNVTQEAVPPEGELVYPATSLAAALAGNGTATASHSTQPGGSPAALPAAFDRPVLLHRILNHLLAWRPRLEAPDFWRAWDEWLAFKGEWVQVGPGWSTAEQAAAAAPQAQTGYLARVIGLDPSGCLRVQAESGEQIILRTGELHIRPQDWVK